MSAEKGVRLPCSIWDISEEGARLAAPHPERLPSTFTLLLSSDGTATKYCRVAWRSKSHLERCQTSVVVRLALCLPWRDYL